MANAGEEPECLPGVRLPIREIITGAGDESQAAAPAARQHREISVTQGFAHASSSIRLGFGLSLPGRAHSAVRDQRQESSAETYEVWLWRCLGQSFEQGGRQNGVGEIVGFADGGAASRRGLRELCLRAPS